MSFRVLNTARSLTYSAPFPQSITTPTQFSLSVNTTQGIISIPQFGGQIALAGRESKILVANYPFGSSKLEYSTAEVCYSLDSFDDIAKGPSGSDVDHD